MTNTGKALYTFFSGFGLPAYAEENVPSGTELPYITFELAQPDWRAPGALRARVWYRKSDYVDMSAKLDAISAAIGEGTSVKTDGGYIELQKENNFIQFQATDEPTLKVAYLSMIIHAHTT